MSALSVDAKTKGRPYDETFRVPGGALCLDFCNSGQAMRDSRQTEWIRSFTDLVDWLEAAQAMPHAQAARFRQAAGAASVAAASTWRRAMVLREVLFRVFDAAARGLPAAPTDLDQIESAHAATRGFARLARSDEGYAWTLDSAATTPQAVLQPIVQSALDLLISTRFSRLRRCGSVTCHWLFLDETKNHSRRWCEMASCGNLAKVKRHRAKSRTQHAGQEHSASSRVAAKE